MSMYNISCYKCSPWDHIMDWKLIKHILSFFTRTLQTRSMESLFQQNVDGYKKDEEDRDNTYILQQPWSWRNHESTFYNHLHSFYKGINQTFLLFSLKLQNRKFKNGDILLTISKSVQKKRSQKFHVPNNEVRIVLSFWQILTMFCTNACRSLSVIVNICPQKGSLSSSVV